MNEKTTPLSNLAIVMVGSLAGASSNLGDHLRARGHRVEVFSPTATERAPFSPVVSVVPMPVERSAGLVEALSDADAVIVTTTLGPVATTVADSQMVDLALQYMKAGATLVLSGGLAVVGVSGAVVSEQAEPEYVPDAASSAHASELRILGDDYRRGIVIRAGIIYSHDDRVLAASAAFASQHGVSRFFGEEGDQYPTVHVQDLLDLYALVIENPGARGLFHAATGSTTNVELARLIADAALVHRVEPWTTELLLAETGIQKLPPRVSVALAEGRARAELGWRPTGESIQSAYGRSL